MNLRNTLILLVLVAVASSAVTRYYFPQVKFKNIETTKEVIRNDVRTIVKEVTRKDGTREIVTETVDRSVKKERSTSETTIASKNDWVFSIGMNTDFSFGNEVVYDLHVQRRILGPFFLGAKATTDRTIGVSIGMEF